MITSRLIGKARTTVPHAVRAALRLCPGDEIVYLIEAGRVVMTRAQPEKLSNDPFGAFAEWNSLADREAYAGL